MLPPEFTESFIHRDRQIQAIVTEFDGHEDGMKPGHRTRIVRILVEDEDAALLREGELVTRISIGNSYRLRTPVKIGTALTEIDLHPAGSQLERKV